MSLSSTSRGKGGRPPGSGNSAHNLIVRDLKETLRLQAELRDMIRKQIPIVERELQTADLSKRIEGMEALARTMDTLTKSLQQTFRHLQVGTPEAAAPKQSASDQSKLLEQLIGKK